MDLSAGKGVHYGGEGGGDGLSLARVHLYDDASIQHQRGQELLVGDPERKLALGVQCRDGPVELRGEQNLRAV